MQGKQRAPCPHWLSIHGNAGTRRLASKRVALVDPSVLQATARNTGIAEQRLTERPCAQPRDCRPWPAQRTCGDHAVCEHHGTAIAIQHHFADISQFIRPQLQGYAFIAVGASEPDANRANGKLPAVLSEPAGQRTLVGKPSSEFTRQKEWGRVPALASGFQFEMQYGLPGKTNPHYPGNDSGTHQRARPA